MFIIDLVVALIVGLVIVSIVSRAFGTKGPWGSLLWFFLVVSLFAWAGGVWLVPFGPMFWGIGWLPIIIMGFFVALLLTAASPRTPRWRRASKEEVTSEAGTRAVVDIIFWVVIICLLIFGIGHYTSYPRVW
jgi:type VI protein secretion system component VasK